MSYIDYAEPHIIAIPESLMQDVYELIAPETYLRFYNDKNDSKDKSVNNDNNKKDNKNNKNTYKDQYSENQQLLNLLKDEQNRSKNLMSLSLLYQRIRKVPYRNGYCTFTLNTLLTFEFYITLSHWINNNEGKKEEINEKMETLEALSTEYSNLQEEWLALDAKIENLRTINNAVAKSLRVEHIYALTVEYQKFTPTEHAKRCLIE